MFLNNTHVWKRVKACCTHLPPPDQAVRSISIRVSSLDFTRLILIKCPVTAYIKCECVICVALSAGLSPSPRPVIRLCPARNDRLHTQRIRFAHSGLVLGLRRRKYDPYYGYENNSSLICGSRDLTIGRLNKYVIID